MARIYVIEDNESIREAVVAYLELAEFEVVAFERLRDVQDAIARKPADLIVIDVMLPDGNGFDFAKQMHRRETTPFIFLTARDQESDRITGFELGADDYIVKPFSPKELVLRVQAVLRRLAGAKEGSRAPARPRSWLYAGRYLEVDELQHELRLDGDALQLTGAEWRILLLFAHHPGIVFSRERIVGEALGYLYEGSERTVDTHIKNIRGKLGDSGWIETVRGFGYRFRGVSGGDRDRGTA